MEVWRLLLTGSKDAFTNMAIEEAVLLEIAAGKSKPTVRFFTWLPSAVSIGYFQGINEEVDLEACKLSKVDVVRRITGGGAVYHDTEGEITYSVSVPESNAKIPKNILDSYAVLCKGLVEGFKILGLNAEFKPVNDILVSGKKISGSAHTRKLNTILQHGTILCDVNPKLMFSLLKVPDEKMRDKLIRSAEERVTSIKRELGEADRNKVVNAMIKGFENALDIELEEGFLTKDELELATKLRDEKYGTKEWNFKR
ncbi:MAG: biotin/lipoate A/B protein ligase family protein [Candidatus Thermoplasmatota archaeon]|nr:biotin/lipoate A/B protein ligase family protein [Candidatus Thermoplasmatota archaeon]